MRSYRNLLIALITMAGIACVLFPSPASDSPSPSESAAVSPQPLKSATPAPTLEAESKAFQAPTDTPNAPTPTPPPPSEGFSIPFGNDPLGTPEEALFAWGANALAVEKAGSFLLFDNATRALERYSRTGERIDSMPLGEPIVSVRDIVVADDGSLVILDTAAIPPAVHRLSPNGNRLRSVTLPIHFAGEATHVRIGPSRALHVVTEAARAFQVSDEMGRPLDRPKGTPGVPGQEGTWVGLPNIDWERDPHSGKITLQFPSGDPPLTIHVTVTNTLGSLWHLGPAPDGGFFLVVEEMAYDGALQVDQTVRRYTEDGQLIGTARVPLNEYTFALENHLAIGPTGDVYALILKEEEMEIRRLSFEDELPPVLARQQPALSPDPSSDASLVRTSAGAQWCRSREAMREVCTAYLRHRQTLSNENIDGTCARATAPRYLNGAGVYPSVPYDAGGWDSAAQFEAHMEEGYRAGDIDFEHDGGLSECSRGVDCSGLVSEAWGMSTKLFTWSIPHYSVRVNSVDDLLFGDVLNKFSSVAGHAVIFSQFGVNGLEVVHATTYNGWDRAIASYHTWAFFHGYELLRYRYVCR